MENLKEVPVSFFVKFTCVKEDEYEGNFVCPPGTTKDDAMKEFLRAMEQEGAINIRISQFDLIDVDNIDTSGTIDNVGPETNTKPTIH